MAQKNNSKVPTVIIVVAVILISSIFISSLGNKNNTNNSIPLEYEYAQLGSDCQSASEKYKNSATSLRNKIETEYSDAQIKIAKLQSTISGNSESGISSLNNARSGYASIYADGGMTKEEYDIKMIQIDQAQTSTYTNPSSSYQHELDGIKTNLDKSYEDGKLEAASMDDSALKLNVCAESAKSQKDFSISDVAEFKLLIEKSNIQK